MHHIITKLEQGKIMNINCMQQECTNKFYHIDIEKIQDPELTKLFASKYRAYTTQLATDAKWCPTPDCDTVVSTKNAKKNLVTCPTCSRQLCVKCGKFSHLGRPCLSNELEYDWLQIKQCPTCFTPIQRIDGCNEMHCTRCDNFFCFRCGVDITNDFLHFTTTCDQFEDYAVRGNNEDYWFDFTFDRNGSVVFINQQIGDLDRNYIRYARFCHF